MGSLAEVQKVLWEKDEEIDRLREEMKIKDLKIQELKSQLDKCLSVLPNAVPPAIKPRANRMPGISAEPRVKYSINDIRHQSFKRYSKSQR